jgi:hypothetical protein
MNETRTRMTRSTTLKRRLAMAPVVVGLGLSLQGCANDGLELNGKVFDWLGVSESASAAARRENRMPDRPPLVMPPSTKALPAPGSGQEQDPMLASLQDPEVKKARDAAERQALHLAYCRGEKNWQERAFRRDDGANRSPFGPCNQMVGDQLQPSNTGTQTTATPR